MARGFSGTAGPIRGITVGLERLASILSEVLYEHWLEMKSSIAWSPDPMGTVPGARRRVFYFAAVISGE